MSKSEMVIELQTILKDLKNITLNLDDNISNLRDFLDNERFIPEELGNEIRGQLEDINKKQKEISLKYRMLNADGNTASYAVLEEELFELQKVIEENEKYICRVVQGTVREVKAEHTPTYTTAKERQGIQAINVKSCPICRKKCGTLFVVYCTFFIFVRKVIYLKKITADFAVSTMFKTINN